MRVLSLFALVGVSVMTGQSTNSTIGEASKNDCGCDSPFLQDVSQGASTEYELHGAVSHVHDPSIAKEGKTYYVFSTGPGIQVRTSTDRIHWTVPTRVFEKVPSWTKTTIPRSTEFYWAPDISYFNHRWNLYYTVSTFGRNRSAIGLATNVTLDPTSSDFRWVDEGPAFQSYPTDNFNAIDPNIVLDSKGQPWLSFGSFWSGIKILRVDMATGRPTTPGEAPFAIAMRPHTKDQPGAIEAPFIIRRGHYFYLFVSFDFCCRGVNSTYNIRVGRSREPSGPFLDRDGIDMMAGGGTLVLESSGRWHGPGGNSFFRDGRKEYLVYHAYDGNENGVPKLQINPVTWDKAGWPSVKLIDR